jgi:hypothetical protein
MINDVSIHTPEHFPRVYFKLYKDKDDARLIITVNYKKIERSDLPEGAKAISEWVDTGEPTPRDEHCLTVKTDVSKN